jgi:D-amino peptidase
MKIYMMTDMEGVSGIHRVEFVQRGTDRFEEGRRLLTADVNAAIAGCFDAGATEVVVRDGHGGADSFLIEDIDPRAVVDHGGGGRWWGCVDGSFDAVMIVGQHAMAGTLDGFLDHTQSSTSWYEFTINGRAVGEIGQFACMAGAFDLPVVLVTGDRAACDEATELLGPVEVVSVKEGKGRNFALCLAPKRARQLIREGAARAMKRVGKIAPWKPEPPLEVVLKFNRSDYADEIAWRKGNERIDARTVRRVVDHPLRLFDIMMDSRPIE